MPAPTIAAADTGKLLIFALFLIGGVIHSIFKKGGMVDTLKQTPPGGSAKDRRNPATTLPPPANAEEARVRRLLEALGQTGRQVSTALPPFPGSAQNSPLPPPLPAMPPRRPPTPPPPPAQIELPPPTKATMRNPGRAPAARRAGAPPPSRGGTGNAAGLREILRGPAGPLRQAILLKEVLGPPRSVSE